MKVRLQDLNDEFDMDSYEEEENLPNKKMYARTYLSKDSSEKRREKDHRSFKRNYKKEQQEAFIR